MGIFITGGPVELVELLRSSSNPQRPVIPAISLFKSANGCERPAEIRITKSRERAHTLTPAEVDKLITCYQEGESTYTLARRFGINRHTVSEHLRRSGVPRDRSASKRHHDEHLGSI